MKTKTRLFSFYIFVDLFRKVKKMAEEERVSVSHVINRIVRDHYEGK